MKQFYGACADAPKLATLLRELPWTHNLLTLGQTKRAEARDLSAAGRAGEVEYT
jgi:hypothetical protein